jgi:hypothetical protein
MSQIALLIYCTAKTLNCKVTDREIVTVTRHNGDLVSPKGIVPDMGVLGHEMTEGILAPFRIECPASVARQTIDVTLLKMFDFDDFLTSSPTELLSMSNNTLERLIKTHLKPSDYFYMSVGHTDLYNQLRYNQKVNLAFETMKSLWSSSPKSPYIASAGPPHTFFLSHPPQHFNSTTGEYSKPIAHLHCSCTIPDIEAQPTAIHAKNLKIAVQGFNELLVGNKDTMRVGFADLFDKFHNGEMPACALHLHAIINNDCTHYIHLAVWLGALKALLGR